MPSKRKQYLSELWMSFIEGDKQAFAMIYDQAYDGLYTYGNSMNITDHQVRDIIQDLFIKLYTQPLLITQPESLHAYLFSSMRNRALNIISSSRKHIYIDELHEFNLDFSIKEDFLEKKQDQEYIYKKIHEILKILTPRQKEIIQLRFLHEMEYEEIAIVMKLSEQSARNLLSRAMHKARETNIQYVFLLFLSLQ